MRSNSDPSQSTLPEASPSRSRPAGVSSASDNALVTTRVEVLGKYHTIAALGSGGMSKVHLAVVRGPAGFHKLVVLKELRATLSGSDDFLPMFLDEARLAARLNHPNVVQTNEVGQSGDAYFIAMEYLDGQPLTNILRRINARGGLPLPMALRIIADVCAGLHHAHELRDFDGSPLNVVHRDVSPQNIFVTYDGSTKVVDFGVAKAEGRAVHTGIGVLKGKVRYMAPEQARGEPVDRRADIFALGVVLYETVALRRLWHGKDFDTLQELRAGHIPRSPKEVRPEVPDAIDCICRRALAPTPADRYLTALEMQGDLEQCLETMTPHVTPRVVGALVSGLFAQERQQIHAVIEQQLRKLELIDSGAASWPRLSIPVLTLGGAALTPSSPPSSMSVQPVAAPGKHRAAPALLGAALLALLIGVGVAAWRTPGKPVSPDVAPATHHDVAAEASSPVPPLRSAPVIETSVSSRTPEPVRVAPRVWKKPAFAIAADPQASAAGQTSQQPLPPPAHSAGSDEGDPLGDRK
jgi:serine/threonine protein kinase